MCARARACMCLPLLLRFEKCLTNFTLTIRVIDDSRKGIITKKNAIRRVFPFKIKSYDRFVYSFVTKCKGTGDIRSTSAALAFSRTIRLKYTGINCRARNGKIHSKYITTSYLSSFIGQISCPPFQYRNLHSNLGTYTDAYYSAV